MINEDGGVGYKPDAGAHLDHILGTLATTEASEMDGKMSNALRNILFGDSFQEDLCARNIFRGREMAMPSYAGIATCFGTTPDATVCAPMHADFAFLGLPVEVCMHANCVNTAHAVAVGIQELHSPLR